jgi:hypothetical protein
MQPGATKGGAVRGIALENDRRKDIKNVILVLPLKRGRGTGIITNTNRIATAKKGSLTAGNNSIKTGQSINSNRPL